MSHLCHAVDCTTEVAPEFWGCTKHWYMVPAQIRANIWHTYRRGQETDKQPSDEYMYWHYKAKIEVAKKEGKTDSPSYRRAMEFVQKVDNGETQ